MHARIFFLTVVLVGCASTVSWAQRLLSTAIPEHYDVHFAPDLTTERFSGQTAIRVRVLAPNHWCASTALVSIHVAKDASARTRRQTLETIELCASLREDQSDDLQQWLNGNAAAENVRN